jgi:hypothetical protein
MEGIVGLRVIGYDDHVTMFRGADWNAGRREDRRDGMRFLQIDI